MSCSFYYHVVSDLLSFCSHYSRLYKLLIIFNTFCDISFSVEVVYVFNCIGRELIGRHRSSWLPEGEAPPPYHGAVSVHHQSSVPLQVQQSFPDLPTFGYRSVVLAVCMVI